MIRASNVEIDWQSYEKVNHFMKKHPRNIGIDEVGRGAIAGPILVAGIGLKTPLSHFLLTDSKLLDNKERYSAITIIEKNLAYIKIIEIPTQLINERKMNLNQLILQSILKILDDAADAGITGALIDYIPVQHPRVETLSLKWMELLSTPTAAASIVAKIKRDKLMKKYGEIYKNYEFARNSGYATAKHIKFLKKHGISDIHRKHFAEKILKKGNN